jgi:ABC-2 type transport system permease protein
MTAAPFSPPSAAFGAAPFWRKYLAAAAIALRLRLREPAVLIGRNVFYLLILVVFAQLWRALLEGKASAYRPGELLWYVAMTEFITLSQPHFYLEIERDVRNGDIAYHLTRPTSYLATKLCGGFATMLLSMGCLLVPGALASWWLSGVVPAVSGSLALLVPLTLLGATFLLLCNLLIGLSAFWLQDCTPVYWIWQKALFVLGGLFVPLVFYPSWLRQFAELTPFSAALYGPAHLLFHPDIAQWWRLCARLIAWNALCAVLVAFTYHRALRVIDVHGG